MSAALRVLAPAIVALLGLVSPLAAVDGVIEINQAKALAGGVTASDTAGFPVTIGTAGSYRLTGNLTVSDANTTAIFINVTNVSVTVDLNGFAILGPVVCTGTPVTSCSPTGNGRGIEAAGSVVIRNGIIRGMGERGILISQNGSRVESVQVLHNAGAGIGAPSHATVRDSVAELNGGAGIQVGVGSIVSGCVARHNGDIGIKVAGDGVVSHSDAYSNGSHGISVGNGSTVIGNSANFNTASGIFALAGSTVLDNAARSNTSFGVMLSAGVGYARNALYNNNGGNTNPQANGGVEIGTNVCGTTTDCP